MGHRLGLATRTQISVCKLPIAISFCRHHSVPVPCKNSSAETTVAEGGRNPVAGLWGRTLGENSRIDHLSRLPVMLPSTFDVNWLQVQPQWLPGVSRSNGVLRISGWIGQLSCFTIFSTSLSVAA